MVREKTEINGTNVLQPIEIVAQCTGMKNLKIEKKKQYDHERWLKNPRHNKSWGAVDREDESGNLTRLCKACVEFKAITCFHKQPSCKKGRRSVCKACESRKVRERRARNKNDYKRRAKLNTIKMRYGVTPQEYGEILSAQENRCAICSVDMDSPCVDHCHSTGRVRGLLCNNCNSMLGMAQDKEEILLKAIYYLRKFT